MDKKYFEEKLINKKIELKKIDDEIGLLNRQVQAINNQIQTKRELFFQTLGSIKELSENLSEIMKEIPEIPEETEGSEDSLKQQDQ